MDFQLVESKEEFKKLEPAWRELFALLPDPDYHKSWDWHLPFMLHGSLAPEHPRVILVKQGGELLGLAPLGVDRQSRPLPLRRLFSTGHLVVKPGREEEVCRGLASFICRAKRDWSLLELDHWSPNDACFQPFKQALSDQGVRLNLVHEFRNVVSYMPEGGTAEDYYQGRSRNTRKNIRGGINKLNRVGQWEMVLLDCSGPDVELGLRHYRDVYGQSWRSDQSDLDFQIELGRYLAKQGILRLFILYFKEGDPPKGRPAYPSYEASLDTSLTIPEGMEPIAVEVDVVIGDRVWALKSAFKEEYQNLSPSNVLFWFVMKYFIDQGGYRFMDFLLGDEEYKLRWGEAHENRGRWVGARPGCLLGQANAWFERKLVPRLRQFKHNPSRQGAA